MEICRYFFRISKVIFIIIIFFTIHSNLYASTFENLKKNKKTPYLDFILLKIENRLVQRHGLLGSQPMAFRIQYQSLGSQVDYDEANSRILISIIGVMDKKRYTKKKYKPKIVDCNILRNLLLYGKYGYNIIFQKRNKFLTVAHMEEIFLDRYLKNMSISDKEKEFILKNTFVKVKIIDPVKGNDVFCSGNVAEDLN
tara:strand:+ start:344 stop:934 length:591 start_codon:yes stop_codon:yes gene_type:complete